ncbi:MAG: hypothetical protein E7645_00035 [Ruminococcaceae bacterium]|nr:hypothetical protein [Oscillospiraceae bacterium]
MKQKFKICPWVAWGLLLAVWITAFPTTVVADGQPTLSAVDIKRDDREYDWVTPNQTIYTYDFSSTEITDYSTDAVLATSSLRTNMIFDGNTLSCKPGGSFSFGSSLILGDDYGLYGGDMSVETNITGGKLSLGVRLSRTATDTDRRGIWFTLDGTNTVTVTEPESRLKAVVQASSVISEAKITVKDKADAIELYVNDTLLCAVTYNGYNGALAVLNAQGDILSSKASSDLRPAGYFTLFADGMEGHIDNLTFEHSELAVQKANVQGAPLDYSTWVATDDRDRTTPTDVALREDKQVGVFYFLCQTGEDSEFIQDNTKIFLEDGLDGLKEHLTDPRESGSYYWAEPYFGYYKNVDSWVFRKHAYQLEAAGVDFVFLDFTNGAYYPEGLQVLLDTWLAIRKEGGSTPDICVFSAGKYDAVMGSLRGGMYSEAGFAKYGELFYQYKGKPLTLASCAGDTSELGQWINETFTVRDCWAWKDADGAWNWLQEYQGRNGTFRYVLGGPGRDLNGNFEQLALCVGHHPTTSKGRSYLNTKFPQIQNEDFGFSLDSGAGLGFAFQYEAVKYYDPDMVMITGWNEWVAGLNHSSSGYDTFAGVPDLGFQFVDQFNTEYSRDAEPMKLRGGQEVGFGDNFYYQMASYIRDFKGTGKVTEAGGQISVTLGAPESWETVTPTYGDNVQDTAWRKEDGYFTGHNYINNSGRNDFVSAKVSQDAEYLYFMAETARDVIVDDGQNWMNLYIDTDNNPATGWEGFDLVLNRARDGHYVSVESLADGWEGKHIGQALYTVEGSRMVIRLAKSVVEIEGTATALGFKWADNSTLDGNIMEFMDLGDTAPNDRFAYLYICPEGQGRDAVAVDDYALLTADGSIEPSREESDVLPGLKRPEDTLPEASEPVGNDPDESTEPSDIPEVMPPKGTAPTVYVYSTHLKVMIVLTGGVLGLCAYAAIAMPTLLKRKRK